MQLPRQLRGDLRVNSRVFPLVHPRQVMQKQHRIRRADFVPGARNTDLFHLIVTLAQTGGVDHMQRHAFDLNGLLHLVARGARNRRDDGQFRPRQRIEQRAFARIGLPRNHHLDAFAQQRALLRALHHRPQLRLQPLQLPRRIGLLQKIDLFFREVQSRLHQHAQMDQRVAQRVDLFGERARQRTPRTARSRLGARIDQIGNRLGLGQIDLVVEKRPLRELPRLRQPQLRRRRARQLHAARYQQLQHHRPAMRLQLQHILAGIAVRPRKEQRQPPINRLPVPVRDRQIVRLARVQRAPQQLPHKRLKPLARHPHNAHSPAS
ncbi:hypothetical protein SDC9_80069 [bioreactor metagenome]|uniref:Uncharacterized protein n=1 Tax=bioreactor metagenome TaxID=1076179 RepID=A0A644Z435_9ZZZZ